MNRIPLGRVVLGAFVVLILVFLMLPVLIVVPLSFSDTRFMTFPPPAYSLRCITRSSTTPHGSTPLA